MKNENEELEELEVVYEGDVDISEASDQIIAAAGSLVDALTEVFGNFYEAMAEMKAEEEE